MRTLSRWVLLGLGCYAAWIGMMAVHEFGHVLHAWLSGGSVARVIVPLWGFSRTDLEHNPHPLFVAWGGAIWGCLVPVGLLAGMKIWRDVRAGESSLHERLLPVVIETPPFAGAKNGAPRTPAVRYVLRFFAGFCLIANGAYLGAGSFIRAGDAGDLMQLGSPQWVLILFGCLTAPLGLYLWNGLGAHFGRPKR